MCESAAILPLADRTAPGDRIDALPRLIRLLWCSAHAAHPNAKAASRDASRRGVAGAGIDKVSLSIGATAAPRLRRNEGVILPPGELLKQVERLLVVLSADELRNTARWLQEFKVDS